MEQYNKIVLEAPEGMHYTTCQGKNGELIVRLVPNSSVTEQDSVSQSELVEKFTDKTTFFTKISTEDREKVKEWLEKQANVPYSAKIFLSIVKEAVQAINYDYWIANLEPSVKDGKIYYAKGEKVGAKFSCIEFADMAKEYAPERGSRLSNLYELFMWYALRIVNNLWSLGYVSSNSSKAGNYMNAYGSSRMMEKTGARKCGGYEDGQGNTYKIVFHKYGFYRVGGCYESDGDVHPVGVYSSYLNDPCYTQKNSVGVVVLTK